MFRILFTLFILVGSHHASAGRFDVYQSHPEDGADPWVVRHDDGFYYYTQTTGNDITLWRTRDIADLEHAERKVVWMPAQGAANGSHIWAPELHRLDGRWYLYFAASAGDMTPAAHVRAAIRGDDPFGSYAFPQETDAGKISDASDKWAIDGTVLEYEGQRYFIWSGWEGDVNEQQQHLHRQDGLPGDWQERGSRFPAPSWRGSASARPRSRGPASPAGPGRAPLPRLLRQRQLDGRLLPRPADAGRGGSDEPGTLAQAARASV